MTHETHGSTTGDPGPLAGSPTPSDFTPPAHVLAWAEEWEEMHRTYWQARSILLGWIEARGPIRLADGRLCGFQPSGNEWDHEAVAELFPQLVKSVEASFIGPKEQIERVLDAALEVEPSVNWKVARKVDATAANNVLRGGGPAAEQLLPHRVQKTRLGVR